VATARRHTVFNLQPSHANTPLRAGGDCFFCWEGNPWLNPDFISVYVPRLAGRFENPRFVSWVPVSFAPRDTFASSRLCAVAL
jgi:hypothetical protein